MPFVFPFKMFSSLCIAVPLAMSLPQYFICVCPFGRVCIIGLYLRAIYNVILPCGRRLILLPVVGLHRRFLDASRHGGPARCSAVKVSLRDDICDAILCLTACSNIAGASRDPRCQRCQHPPRRRAGLSHANSCFNVFIHIHMLGLSDFVVAATRLLGEKRRRSTSRFCIHLSEQK